jgi:hypothetical protein
MIGRLLLLYSIIFYTFSLSIPPETTFSLTHAYYHDRRTNSIAHYQRHAHASTRQDAFVVKTALHSFSRRVPNVTDRATVISLAKMAYDAYTAIGGDDWYDLDNPSWPTVRKWTSLTSCTNLSFFYWKRLLRTILLDGKRMVFEVMYSVTKMHRSSWLRSKGRQPGCFPVDRLGTRIRWM